jgi:orotidine-5'-phosphate decarboxylase
MNARTSAISKSAASKSAASTIVLILLGLAGWSGPAAAQQPSQEQVNAIRASCRGDFQAHCPGVQPGGSAALACLKKNVAALSPACQKAVTAVGGAAAPAAEPPAAAAAAAPPHLGYTRDGNINAPAAAPAARSAPAVPAQRAAVPLRVELAILRRACGPDVQVNCPGVRPGGGQVMACLAANEASLSPRCRRELAMAKQNM